MTHLIDPNGLRLPIKLDTTSNGEFMPVPLSRANLHANHLAHESASLNAKRLAIGRRDFLLSTCGAASTLLAFNAANADNAWKRERHAIFGVVRPDGGNELLVA